MHEVDAAQFLLLNDSQMLIVHMKALLKLRKHLALVASYCLH